MSPSLWFFFFLFKLKGREMRLLPNAELISSAVGLLRRFILAGVLFKHQITDLLITLFLPLVSIIFFSGVQRGKTFPTQRPDGNVQSLIRFILIPVFLVFFPFSFFSPPGCRVCGSTNLYRIFFFLLCLSSFDCFLLWRQIQ